MVLWFFFGNVFFLSRNGYGIKVEFCAGQAISLMLIMANSTKWLQFVREFHRAIGICPAEPNQKRTKLNTKNKIILLLSAQYMIVTIAFLVFEAKSMFDFAIGIFITICMLNTIVIYSSFLWQCENLFKLIANFERFIEKSKFASIYLNIIKL